jgi:hypothetical protein
MHYQHWSRQSRFTREHPEFVMVNRNGDTRQWGVPCLAYPEVRKYYQDRYLNLLDGYDFDGLFVCLRSQAKLAEFADQFGFNEPIRNDYKKRYGKDILKQDFNLKKWRDLGGYLTELLTELK